jgi:hypothetical protein
MTGKILRRQSFWIPRSSCKYKIKIDPPQFLLGSAALFFLRSLSIFILYQNWPNSRSQLVVLSIAAAFLGSVKIYSPHSTINSSSFDRIFWINVPLRGSLLPDERNEIKLPKRSDRRTFTYCLYWCLNNYEPSVSKLL